MKMGDLFVNYLNFVFKLFSLCTHFPLEKISLFQCDTNPVLFYYCPKKKRMTLLAFDSVFMTHFAEKNVENGYLLNEMRIKTHFKDRLLK